MFQFTTTTVINGATKGGSTPSYGVYESGNKKVFRTNCGPTFKANDTDATYKVYVAPFKDAEVDEAEIDLSACSDTNATYRLNMYVRSTGNADPMYANDFVFKGKPFYVEFKGGKTAADVAYIANKFMLALYDSRQLDITGEGSTLTIKGMNSYLRFFKVALEKWVTNDSQNGGDYEVIDTTFEQPIEDGMIASTEGNINVTVGCEGNGTYEQILKDLRLPTNDNMAYLNVNTLEMPIPGGEYTQITVRMCHELVGYPGGIGVNNPTSSITTHVFFVIASEKANFLSKLTEVLGVEAIEVPATAEDEDDDDRA